MNRKIEIFRSGKHTDSSGNSRDWSLADLDVIASSYNPAFHEAPVCIGHPKDNAPAWAWVKSVTREGQSLFAEIGDEVEEFSEMLKKKMFKKRSISLYPDMSLRHLALLGAQPPAVKGLKDMAFADKGEPISIDFADWGTVWSFKSVGNLFQGIRDYFIDTKDLETANRLMPQYEIDNLKSMQAEEKAALFTEENDVTQAEFETKLAAEKALTVAAEAKAADFSEKLDAEVAKVATLTADINGIKAAAQEKEFSEFCDGLVTAGKLLPADKAGTVAVMRSLAGLAEQDFSEGEATVKKAPLAMFQARLEAGSKVIEFGEVATNGKSKTAEPDDKLTALTKEKVAANKGMNYSEAGKLVLKEHPELNVIVEMA